ncbi:MAG: glutaredoxin family protein [Ideonella sp.]|nr:glutaredoxin family protein [Ideonella sp.]
MLARRVAGHVLAALAAGAAVMALAAAPSSSAAGPDRTPVPAAPANAAPVLEVFVTDGCPHCASAKAWLAELARERPQLQVRLRVLDGDVQAQDELVHRSLSAGVWPPGVPTFVLGGQVLVGFDPQATPRILLEAIDHGRAAPTEVESALFGTLSANRLGLPLFTLALGLLDGFNACAMWVLLFLLTLLVRLNDRRRMALVAGTFVLASGAVYYALMAAWLGVFVTIGLSPAVWPVLGVAGIALGAINVKDYFAFGRGPSLAIPASARPGLVARMHRVLRAQALPASLAAVAALAVAVNFIELLCTAGLPAIYTAVLAQQPLGAAAHHAYLALYIAAYMADDAVMVGLAVAALGSGKLTERAGRRLKLASGLVMVALGLVLLWRPQWLA